MDANDFRMEFAVMFALKSQNLDTKVIDWKLCDYY